MIEIWKAVQSYEGLYEISSLGKVKSVTKIFNNRVHQCRVMKTSIGKTGYERLMLNHPRTGKKYAAVHRLVALAFLSNPKSYKCINHKDGNKLNNNVSNLEWCSHSMNTIHAYRKGLKKKLCGQNNYKAKLVLDTETGIFYESATEAAASYNVDISTMCRWINGRFRKGNTQFIRA